MAKKDRFSYKDFLNMFPNEDKCLMYLFKQRYGHLEDFNKYYKVKDRKTFAHSETGKQISPTANTIFHKSSTSLRTWYYVIYLFSCSKNGISSYEIERLTGVTHKTAWRMGKKIRELFTKRGIKLTGVVEVDETFIGGKAENKHYDKRVNGEKQVTVIGGVERGGDVVARVIDSVDKNEVRPFVRGQIEIGATLITDEAKVYHEYGYTHDHKTVNHSAKEYVNGNVYTNTIEGFWSQLKRSIDGTHHLVSPKHLQMYINEFAWKYNNRNCRMPLFLRMMGGV